MATNHDLRMMTLVPLHIYSLLLSSICVQISDFFFLFCGSSQFYFITMCYGIQSHQFMGNRWGNSGKSVRLILGGSKITADVTAAMKLKDAYSLEGKL